MSIKTGRALKRSESLFRLVFDKQYCCVKRIEDEGDELKLKIRKSSLISGVTQGGGAKGI